MKLLSIAAIIKFVHTTSKNTYMGDNRVKFVFNSDKSKNMHFYFAVNEISRAMNTFLHDNKKYHEELVSAETNDAFTLLIKIFDKECCADVYWNIVKEKTTNDRQNVKIMRHNFCAKMQGYIKANGSERVCTMVQLIANEICGLLDEYTSIEILDNRIQSRGQIYIDKLRRVYNRKNKNGQAQELTLLHIRKITIDTYTADYDACYSPKHVTNFEELYEHLDALSRLEMQPNNNLYIENNFLYLFLMKVTCDVDALLTKSKYRLSVEYLKDYIMSETKSLLDHTYKNQFIAPFDHSRSRTDKFLDFNVHLVFRISSDDREILKRILKTYGFQEPDIFYVMNVLDHAIQFVALALVYSLSKFFVPELSCCDCLQSELPNISYDVMKGFSKYFLDKFYKVRNIEEKLTPSRKCLDENDMRQSKETEKFIAVVNHGRFTIF